MNFIANTFLVVGCLATYAGLREAFRVYFAPYRPLMQLSLGPLHFWYGELDELVWGKHCIPKKVNQSFGRGGINNPRGWRTLLYDQTVEDLRELSRERDIFNDYQRNRQSSSL